MLTFIVLKNAAFFSQKTPHKLMFRKCRLKKQELKDKIVTKISSPKRLVFQEKFTLFLPWPLYFSSSEEHSQEIVPAILTLASLILAFWGAVSKKNVRNSYLGLFNSSVLGSILQKKFLQFLPWPLYFWSFKHSPEIVSAILTLASLILAF